MRRGAGLRAGARGGLVSPLTLLVPQPALLVGPGGRRRARAVVQLQGLHVRIGGRLGEPHARGKGCLVGLFLGGELRGGVARDRRGRGHDRRGGQAGRAQQARDDCSPGYGLHDIRLN